MSIYTRTMSIQALFGKRKSEPRTQHTNVPRDLSDLPALWCGPKRGPQARVHALAFAPHIMAPDPCTSHKQSHLPSAAAVWAHADARHDLNTIAAVAAQPGLFRTAR